MGIKLRFEGFRAVTRDQTLSEGVQTAEELMHAARLCLKRVDFNARMRFIRVRAGNW